ISFFDLRTAEDPVFPSGAGHSGTYRRTNGDGLQPEAPERRGLIVSSRLELDGDVRPVLEPHRVGEADQALAQRHDDRAGAEATTEEADAAHERSVGDAGRDEEGGEPGRRPGSAVTYRQPAGAGGAARSQSHRGRAPGG